MYPHGFCDLLSMRPMCTWTHLQSGVHKNLFCASTVCIQSFWAYSLCNLSHTGTGIKCCCSFDDVYEQKSLRNKAERKYQNGITKQRRIYLHIQSFKLYTNCYHIHQYTANRFGYRFGGLYVREKKKKKKHSYLLLIPVNIISMNCTLCESYCTV